MQALTFPKTPRLKKILLRMMVQAGKEFLQAKAYHQWVK
jgi:hypothetical protein